MRDLLSRASLIAAVLVAALAMSNMAATAAALVLDDCHVACCGGKAESKAGQTATCLAPSCPCPACLHTVQAGEPPQALAPSVVALSSRLSPQLTCLPGVSPSIDRPPKSA